MRVDKLHSLVIGQCFLHRLLRSETAHSETLNQFLSKATCPVFRIQTKSVSFFDMANSVMHFQN